MIVIKVYQDYVIRQQYLKKYIDARKNIKLAKEKYNNCIILSKRWKNVR